MPPYAVNARDAKMISLSGPAGVGRQHPTNPALGIESRWISSATGVFLAAEIAVPVLPELPVSRVQVVRRMPYDQGQAPWQARIGAPNSWALSLDALAGGSSERDTAARSIHGRYPDAV